MIEKPKRKRDLLSTFQSIERYHRRQSVLMLHVVLSIALQLVMWGNWYASYVRYGLGFTQNYFADRVIVSGILTMVIIGHYALTRMTGAKDRLVVLALQQHEDELRQYESESDDEPTTLDDDESELQLIENTRRRLTK
jgi:hypothetical protein